MGADLLLSFNLLRAAGVLVGMEVLEVVATVALLAMIIHQIRRVK